MPKPMIQKFKAQILEIILLLIILGLLILWKFSGDIIIFLILGFILLLYGWESGVIRRALKKARQDILKEKLVTILLLIILILLLIWKFNTEAIVLWIIFCAFLFYSWDRRVVAGVALAFLISCPILLIFKKEAIAEQIAIYAYYFLAMTVVLKLIEH